MRIYIYNNLTSKSIKGLRIVSYIWYNSKNTVCIDVRSTVEYVANIWILMWKQIKISKYSRGKKATEVQFPVFIVTFLTSKIGSISQLHLLVELGDDTCNAMLNKVHLFPHCAFPDNVIVGLENFKLQLAQHPRHKVGVRIGKQRHGGHKLAAVEVDNFLVEGGKKEKCWFNRWDHAINNSVISTQKWKMSFSSAAWHRTPPQIFHLCRLHSIRKHKWIGMHIAALSLMLLKHFPFLLRRNFLARNSYPDEFALWCRLQAISLAHPVPSDPAAD